MPAHPFKKQRPLFKAYDIRGNHQLFTTDFIQALSHAFAQKIIDSVENKTLVLGYDMRKGSKGIAQQFAKQFTHYGIKVIWLGFVTTPIMAFWANQYEGHGVIATASHSEHDIIGIKWLINAQSPSSDDILSLYHSLASVQTDQPTLDDAKPASIIQLSQQHLTATYYDNTVDAIDALEKNSDYIYSDYIKNTETYNKDTETNNAHSSHQLQSNSHCHTRRLNIVIDCLNGATGPFAQSFFAHHSSICDNVTVLNDTPDGQFPKGDPDPMQDNRLSELSEQVVSSQADIGLAFDGDGDRLMIVDDKGDCLAPDHLLYLLARVAIEDYSAQMTNITSNQHSDKAPIIIFDVKCAHHLPLLIQQIGAIPQMSKTGSGIIRRTLQSRINNEDHQILFAGELSGHFLFNDGLFLLHDDAMYAGLRLLHWLQAQPHSLSEITASLPHMVSTPDVYLPLADYEKDDIKANLHGLVNISPAMNNNQHNQNQSNAQTTDINYQTENTLLIRLTTLCRRLQTDKSALPHDSKLTCIDGIRLDFSNGFGIIRPSNTSNSLTVRFAGNSLSDLRHVQNQFVSLCRFLNNDLANQVANIGVKSR